MPTGNRAGEAATERKALLRWQHGDAGQNQGKRREQDQDERSDDSVKTVIRMTATIAAAAPAIMMSGNSQAVTVKD